MMPPKDAWWWNSSMICWASDTSMVSMREVLLVESAQPLCPLGENLVSKKTYRLGWLFMFDFSGVCSIWQGFLKKFC